MITLLGFLTVAVVLFLLLTNRSSAVVALIAVPVAAALIAGSSLGEVGSMINNGIGGVAGVVAMFVFGILYFGVMRDAGMFQPVVDAALKYGGSNPIALCIATAALAIVTHLDGAGATTFLITIPALLPLYEALGVSRLVLTTIVGLGAGVMNMVPWGGPGARAATVLGVDPNEIWLPLLPAQGAGLLAVLAVAAILGLKEKRRLERAGTVLAGEPAMANAGGGTGTAGTASGPGSEPSAGSSAAGADAEIEALRRPKLFWVNVALTVLTVGTLISGILPAQAVFMIALVIALMINYPGLKAQGARIDSHAQGAILMASTLLAAGVLLGVMDETGMTEGMAITLTSAIPEVLAPAMPVIVGILGVPMSFLFGPDPYYYGVLPILTSVAEGFGIDPMLIAQASLLGEETVGFPLTPMTGSFFLLVGLAKVNIGDHIKHMFLWAWGVSLFMLLVAVVTGVIPIWAA